MYSTPYDSPPEFQWDPDSAPHQSVNCGPSSAEKVANFFKNLATYGIERTRRLAANHDGGTNLGEQKLMLSKRGIAASVFALTPSEVRDKIKTARRPIIIWMNMASVPEVVKKNTFTGNHALAALGLARATCAFHNIVEDGIWIMDPNFHRDRPTHPPRLFYCNRIFAAAAARIGRWVVVPDAPKVIPVAPAPLPAAVPHPVVPTLGTPYAKVVAVTATTLLVRSAPRTSASHVASTRRGQRLTTRRITTAGGSYRVGAKTRRDWLQVTVNGHTGWIARGWTRLA